MSARREPWGTTRAGDAVELVTLERGALRARLTSFGATLVALEVPDRRGERGDVVLGFDGLAGYDSAANPYFGGLIGRCANRIGGARFELGGRGHSLTVNEGHHHLHGGVRGFDRRAWTLELGADAVTFRRRSREGEEGYPGALDVAVTYALLEDALGIEAEARTDAPTLCNLTQHSYFNLSGAETVLDHELAVDAAHVVAVDDQLVPTGALAALAGTRFDLRGAARLRERVRSGTPRGAAGGIDLCYAVGKLPTGHGAPRPVARLSEPTSGRTLAIESDAPGLQVYTGHYLDGVSGKGGRTYGPHAGLCLESQGFPDAVHHAAFPSVVLRPGEPYVQRTLWRFGTS